MDKHDEDRHEDERGRTVGAMESADQWIVITLRTLKSCEEGYEEGGNSAEIILSSYAHGPLDMGRMMCIALEQNPQLIEAAHMFKQLKDMGPMGAEMMRSLVDMMAKDTDKEEEGEEETWTADDIMEDIMKEIKKEQGDE